MPWKIKNNIIESIITCLVTSTARETSALHDILCSLHSPQQQLWYKNKSLRDEVLHFAGYLPNIFGKFILFCLKTLELRWPYSSFFRVCVIFQNSNNRLLICGEVCIHRQRIAWWLRVFNFLPVHPALTKILLSLNIYIIL